MFSETLGPFFDVKTGFASSAVYQGATVPVIIDNEYLGIGQGGYTVEGAEVSALVMASNFPVVAHGHSFSVGNTVYKVVGVEPDGTGIVRLRLEKQ